MSVVVVSRFTVPNVGYFGKHPTWRWPAQWGGEGWPCFVVSADTRCQERLGGIHCSKPAGHEGGHFSDTMHFGWSG